MEDVTLSVGTSDVPGSLMIPAVLGEFRKKHPKVLLDVHQGNSRSVLRELVDENIELGFVGGRYEDERVSFEPIGEDVLVCAVSPDLNTGCNESLSQAQLCRIPLIGWENGSGTQKAIQDSLNGTWINKDSLKIVSRFGTSDSVRRALINGAGYAFISERVITDELANGQLMTVRIPAVKITRKFYAIRRNERELSPAASAFLKIMHSRWG
jgi:DNA-binding transcriptional LysR family regulator